MVRLDGPRKGSFHGMTIGGRHYPDGSWLEDEAFALPDGGFTRRAKARCEDGKLRVFRCSMPDTYFSIPARGKIGGKIVEGFLSGGEEGLTFTQHENDRG